MNKENSCEQDSTLRNSCEQDSTLRVTHLKKKYICNADNHLGCLRGKAPQDIVTFHSLRCAHIYANPMNWKEQVKQVNLIYMLPCIVYLFLRPIATVTVLYFADIMNIFGRHTPLDIQETHPHLLIYGTTGDHHKVRYCLSYKVILFLHILIIYQPTLNLEPLL